jgi:hypothetical protein
MAPRARATKKASDKVKEAMTKPAKASRFCAVKGCPRRSTYGPVGGKPSRCKKHILPEMIDVRSKRCEDPGCKFIATFGVAGGRRTHCRFHKPPEMVNVVCQKCIECIECPLTASFGHEGGKALYCVVHKKDGMLDVRSRKCDEEGCPLSPVSVSRRVNPLIATSTSHPAQRTSRARDALCV